MTIDCQTWTISQDHEPVRSLVWTGDSLVDWACGGMRFDLSGSFTGRIYARNYRFDAACSSPSGDYVVKYERLGTKGVVLHHGNVVREINRSYNHADDYEYPIVLARLASGREVLIHCPNDYNCLEIDDLASGERLTQTVKRDPCDFFHSRLATDGKLLLSAGWVWHPMDVVGIYDLDEALANPSVLDGWGQWSEYGVEISSAAILEGGRIAVATAFEDSSDEEPQASDDLQPNSLAVYDMHERRIVSQVRVAEPIGTMMPLGRQAVVGLFHHPKVFDLASGDIVWRMPELHTGLQTSSICRHLPPNPPLALDPVGGRFAVATGYTVQVVQLRHSPD